MFYQNVIELCRQHHVSPSAMARELGLSNNAPTKWKTGSVPRTDTIQKIADYFGVTVDYLLADDAGPTNYMGNISNSAVVQGVSAGSVSVNNGAAPAAAELSEQEVELLRVFRLLDGRAKTAVMSFLYEQEDKIKK